MSDREGPMVLPGDFITADLWERAQDQPRARVRAHEHEGPLPKDALQPGLSMQHRRVEVERVTLAGRELTPTDRLGSISAEGAQQIEGALTVTGDLIVRGALTLDRAFTLNPVAIATPRRPLLFTNRCQASFDAEAFIRASDRGIQSLGADARGEACLVELNVKLPCACRVLLLGRVICRSSGPLRLDVETDGVVRPAVLDEGWLTGAELDAIDAASPAERLPLLAKIGAERPKARVLVQAINAEIGVYIPLREWFLLPAGQHTLRAMVAQGTSAVAGNILQAVCFPLATEVG